MWLITIEGKPAGLFSEKNRAYRQAAMHLLVCYNFEPEQNEFMTLFCEKRFEEAFVHGDKVGYNCNHQVEVHEVCVDIDAYSYSDFFPEDEDSL